MQQSRLESVTGSNQTAADRTAREKTEGQEPHTEVHDLRFKQLPALTPLQAKAYELLGLLPVAGNLSVCHLSYYQ